MPIETDTPVEPVEPEESGYVSILDDLGVVTVTVPEERDDVDGEGFVSDADQTWAFVAAAEDLEGYLASWSVAGVEVGATSIASVDPDTIDAQLQGLLSSVAAGYAECGAVAADAQDYDDGFFIGYESLYEDCGANGTVAFAIAGVNYSGTQVMFVRGQITQAYDVQEVYTQIVSTFDTSIGRSQTRG